MNRIFEMIRVRLPMPFQANHMRIPARIRGQARLIDNPKYRLWKQLAASYIQGQNVGRIEGPYTILITVDRPDKRRRDQDNLIKSCNDALVSAGVLEDDSFAHRTTIVWSDRAPGKGAEAVVEIKPWE